MPRRGGRSTPGWAPGLTGHSLLRAPVGSGEETGRDRLVRHSVRSAGRVAGQAGVGAGAAG